MIDTGELHRREAEGDRMRKLERDRFSRSMRRHQRMLWVSTVALLAMWLWTWSSSREPPSEDHEGASSDQSPEMPRT